MSYAEFVELHQALVLKLARAHVRASGERVPPEDLAHEIQMMLEALEKRGTDVLKMPSPDRFLRDAMPVAAARARRRQTLLVQVSAGDDLGQISAELAVVDAELPEAPKADSDASIQARAKLDAITAGLAPSDALVFSLLIEDDRGIDGAAAALTGSATTVTACLGRVAALVRELGTLGDTPGSPEQIQRLLVELARGAKDPTPQGKHVDDPLLALLRSGDTSDDLSDAVGHVVHCVDCRARMAEGEAIQHSVVVMAIETKDEAGLVQRAADETHSHLVERGTGRFTAVVDAENLSGFTSKLEKAAVTRIAVAGQVDIPVVRRRANSLVDSHVRVGTDAAELRAWAGMGRVASKKPQTLSRSALVAIVVLVAALAAGLALLLTPH